MGVPFYGDYDTTETVVIPFNAFTSDDPSASCTITNLVAGDVEIHKDGGTTQRASDSGVTVSIDFDGVTDNHIVSIDLSDNGDAGFYANGSRYQVRIEGSTIDGATINAWIGAFSIGCTLRPTTAGRTLDIQPTGEVDANLTMMGGATQSATDLKDFADTGYDPSTHRTQANLDTIKTQAVTCGAGVTVGVYVGNATAALGVDASGRVDVGKWLGQAATLSSNNKPDVNVDEWHDVLLATTNPLPNAAADAAGGLPVSDAGGLDLDTLLGYLTGAVATAAKLQKYIALLARKDAEAATDLATELGEINNDWGSGAGSYANTSDSQEGIRDTAPLGTAMRGTDSAATAAKLLAYLQLLTRKDAGIATDNATELSELNADEGSGAGAFSNQTDSHEAVRDTAPLGTAMRGTDSAALAATALSNATWTGALAGLLATLASHDPGATLAKAGDKMDLLDTIMEDA